MFMLDSANNLVLQFSGLAGLVRYCTVGESLKEVGFFNY